MGVSEWECWDKFAPSSSKNKYIIHNLFLFFWKKNPTTPRRHFMVFPLHIHIEKKTQPNTGKTKWKAVDLWVAHHSSQAGAGLSPELDHRSQCYCSRLIWEHYRKEAFPGERRGSLQKCSCRTYLALLPHPDSSQGSHGPCDSEPKRSSAPGCTH